MVLHPSLQLQQWLPAPVETAGWSHKELKYTSSLSLYVWNHYYIHPSRKYEVKVDNLFRQMKIIVYLPKSCLE